MPMQGNSFNLIDQIDAMLTDSSHPLDERQARKMSLMLQRQIYDEQLSILDDIKSLRNEISNNQTTVNSSIKMIDDAVKSIRSDVDELWRQWREYRSLTWLLRFKTKPTLVWSTSFVVIVTIILALYRQWLFDQLGLPNIP